MNWDDLKDGMALVFKDTGETRLVRECSPGSFILFDETGRLCNTHATGRPHCTPLDQMYIPLYSDNRFEIARQMEDTVGPDSQMLEGHVPTASADRKGVPLATGCMDYFPDALIAVAKLSRAGNDKHNPGQPLHWSREKSNDHADCILRHLVDRGKIDPEDNILHDVKVAWRALALAQLALERQRG